MGRRLFPTWEGTKPGFFRCCPRIHGRPPRGIRSDLDPALAASPPTLQKGGRSVLFPTGQGSSGLVFLWLTHL